MGLVAAKCTQCGVNIEVNDSKEAEICPVCGKAFVTQKAISSYRAADGEGLVLSRGSQGSSDFQIVSGELRKYKGEEAEIAVPYGVTKIGSRAFAGLNISSVSLPSSVTVIGKQAFKRCERLTRVYLPKNLTSIRDGAFDGCKALTEITLPDGLRELGAVCFCGCIALKEVKLPEGLLTLGDGCFYGSGIEKAELPGSLKSLSGKSYFSYCESLKVVNFKDGIEKLGQARYASFFQGCSKLKSVRLPNGLKYIGNGVFSFSDILKISLPKSVTEIGNNAFAHCESLKEISIPDSVKTIGSEAFQGCISLRTLRLPLRLRRLGYRAFSECTVLEHVALPLLSPDVITDSVPEYVFEDSSIAFLEIPPDFPLGLDIMLDNVKEITTLKAAAREINLLSSSVIKKCRAFTVTEGKLDCRTLKSAISVKLEAGVTAIGEGVFEDGDLESIEISNTVTIIGNRAFAHCRAIKELVIPSSVTHVGRDIISGCDRLERLTAPLSLKKSLKAQIKKLETSGKKRISVDYVK